MQGPDVVDRRVLQHLMPMWRADILTCAPSTEQAFALQQVASWQPQQVNIMWQVHALFQPYIVPV